MNELEIVNSFKSIDPAEWRLLDRGDFPFADLRFFRALENGGCLGQRTGWHPQILLKRDPSGALEGALPLFLKTNSYGEFIFDWAWANAAERSGLRYYPKLCAAIPFVPATGAKTLVRASDSQSERGRAVRSALHAGSLQLAKKLGASSIHFLFTTDLETSEFTDARDWIVRDSFQYHWANRGWQSFADFLAALRSKRRMEIRRERAAVTQLPLRIETLTGALLTENHADSMHAFYFSTTAKMGGQAYLTQGFFRQLFSEMSDRVLLFMAFDVNNEPVAGALNLFEGQTLFGRHWGCRDDYKHLHFELCYYRAIDWALAHGMQLFEAGAQGEHKFTRGFSPTICKSVHWIENPGLRDAIADFVDQERRGIAELFLEYQAHDSFKRPPGQPHIGNTSDG